MTILASAIQDLFDIMMTGSVRKAVKFYASKYVIRATRRCYRGKIIKRNNIEILLTIGKPNYEEREIIKKYLREGKTFPIKEAKIYFLKKK